MFLHWITVKHWESRPPSGLVQWNLSWEATTMRDHLSWQITHFWQKDLNFNITEPVTGDHLSWQTKFCGQWGGLSKLVLLYKIVLMVQFLRLPNIKNEVFVLWVERSFFFLRWSQSEIPLQYLNLLYWVNLLQWCFMVKLTSSSSVFYPVFWNSIRW